MRKTLSAAMLFLSAALAPVALAISKPAPGAASGVPAQKPISGVVVWMGIVVVVALAVVAWRSRSGDRG
jgi:hypothetical protein